MLSLWSLLVGLVACGAPGSHLALPSQVQDAGLERGKPLDRPCLEWCGVNSFVRARTDEAGVPIAFRVSLPSAKWEDVLEGCKAKWGTPAATYKLAPGKGKEESWEIKAEKLHKSKTPKAVSVLDMGSPFRTTQYALWFKGGTLVRVDSDDGNLTATWVDTQRL